MIETFPMTSPSTSTRAWRHRAAATAVLVGTLFASGAALAQTAPKPDWTLQDMPSQAGRIFVVTGGTSGMGYEDAKALAAPGAQVVVAARNPVHSVLFLILAFVNASGLFVLMGAEFLAMILVVVYVGAVAVLFLFVVMMLDIDFAELRAGFVRYAMFGLAIAIVLLAEVIIGVGAWSAGGVDLSTRIAPTDAGTALGQVPNIKAMGLLLYTRYLYVFEAAGFVLLVAMVGAIVLTHRQRGGVMKQNVWKQVSRRSEDAIRKVNPPVGQGVEL